MQQTITDKNFNQKYFALAGAIILLLVVFSNYSRSYQISGENNSDDELICEWQGGTDAAILYMENTDEDDLDKTFSGYPVNIIYIEFPALPDCYFFDGKTLTISAIHDYSQSDLSPPHFM